MLLIAVREHEGTNSLEVSPRLPTVSGFEPQARAWLARFALASSTNASADGKAIAIAIGVRELPMTTRGGVGTPDQNPTRAGIL